MKYFITGHNGFVGYNFLKQLNENDEKYLYNKNSKINILDSETVLNFAGKAHDLKNFINPQDYYTINTEFTKKIFDAFLESNAKVFITLSTVKAVADNIDFELTEDHLPYPITHYGKSKLLAEQYILSKTISDGKRVYVLRPCMIYGPNNKGNMNLLTKFISFGLPWPLGAFENKRSFCSIENLCFIIQELIENESIPSGVYNIADDDPISINKLIKIIADSQNKKVKILRIPKNFIFLLAKIGDFFKLSLNTESLKKLTDNYIVSNEKIKNAICKELPITSDDGLLKTLVSNKHL
jgi:nucleoside-diphosphate-sugar epimerase